MHGCGSSKAPLYTRTCRSSCILLSPGDAAAARASPGEPGQRHRVLHDVHQGVDAGCHGGAHEHVPHHRAERIHLLLCIFQLVRCENCREMFCYQELAPVRIAAVCCPPGVCWSGGTGSCVSDERRWYVSASLRRCQQYKAIYSGRRTILRRVCICCVPRRLCFVLHSVCIHTYCIDVYMHVHVCDHECVFDIVLRNCFVY